VRSIAGAVAITTADPTPFAVRSIGMAVGTPFALVVGKTRRQKPPLYDT
jgi:hypothetical protein